MRNKSKLIQFWSDLKTMLTLVWPLSSSVDISPLRFLFLFVFYQFAFWICTGWITKLLVKKEHKITFLNNSDLPFSTCPPDALWPLPPAILLTCVSFLNVLYISYTRLSMLCCVMISRIFITPQGYGGKEIPYTDTTVIGQPTCLWWKCTVCR